LPNWVLTAGLDLDFNDNGLPNPGLAISLYLPGLGACSASGYYTHPSFTGFGNPSIQRDLGLLYFASPLPTSLVFPTMAVHPHPEGRHELQPFQGPLY
jgi:hypothetical protein